MSDFVAVDGEAVDDSYVLLCASTGERAWRDHGLGSQRCFDFLLSLARPKRKLVCYGLGYDVNQWLASVPLQILRELWRSNYAIWRGYRIKWLPGRWFSVRDREGRFVKVTEVLGFFQSAFVVALDAWGIGAQDEVKVMKEARGSFSVGERARLERYCLQECKDLVGLMGKLEAATLIADCQPHDWIGAGALAGAMLKTRGLADHHAHDDTLTDAAGVDAIMRAYFGGRVEALRLGSYADVAALDVRSAYPWAATQLPSLAGAQLRARKRYDPSADHAIWRVRWAGVDGAIGPLPVRAKRCIYYPRAGEGYYHACEVRTALAAGFDLEVLGGYALAGADGWIFGHSSPPAPPFSWIPDAFKLRARWKAEGNAAEKALKLGLNSLYGKLAQGIGYTGGPPRWQSYFWAGEITARTRARMLQAATRLKYPPLAIATDGIFTTDPAPRRVGTVGRALGSWELSRYETLFVAQAGLYAAEQAGEVVLRSRGHFAKEVDYAELREGFEREGILYTHAYTSRRFVGLGSALMLRDMRKWRKWPEERRQINLYPMRKLAGENGELLPPADAGLERGEISEPYVPKGKLMDTAEIGNVQAGEQPMRNEW